MPPASTRKSSNVKIDSTINLIFNDASELTSNPEKTLAIRDIFGPGSNPKKRYVSSFEQASQYATFLKGLGLTVVYTPGVWDLPHIGHGRYWEQAKRNGDILIVGVELDECVKIRKGPNRPVVPFQERVEMLCHIRHIDLVVPIPDFNEQGKCGLKMVEAIRPDVFVASQRSFKDYDDTQEWTKRIQKYSGRLEIMESQAETSTSNKIRDLVIGYGDLLKENLVETKEAVNAAMAKAWADIEGRIDEIVQKL